MMGEFDVMSEAYDAMINWERRLNNEMPLFQWVFEQVQARSVLDAACGTGRHAAMFASWGLRAQGADVSEEMIAWCRGQYGEKASLSWKQRSYTIKAPEMWDVVICTGNSLALAGDMGVIEQAIAAMAEGAAKALVLHVVNVYARAEGPVVWDKSLRVPLSKGEHLLQKGIHRCGERGYVDFVLTSLASYQVTAWCVEFVALRQGWLEEQLRERGFSSVQIYGGYGRGRFEEGTSSDLIAVASR